MPVPIDRTDYRLDRIVQLGRVQAAVQGEGGSMSFDLYRDGGAQQGVRELLKVWTVTDGGDGVFVFSTQITTTSPFRFYFRGGMTAGLQMLLGNAIAVISEFVAVPDGVPDVDGYLTQRGVPGDADAGGAFRSVAFPGPTASSLRNAAIFACKLTPEDVRLASVARLLVDNAGRATVTYKRTGQAWAQRLDGQTVVSQRDAGVLGSRQLTETADYVMRKAQSAEHGFIIDGGAALDVVGSEPVARGAFYRVTVQRIYASVAVE